METPTILDTALTLHHAGISVVPVAADGTKRPALPWARFQKDRAVTTEIRSWFHPGGTTGLGAITGGISGNLELTEIEGHAAHHIPTLETLAHDSGLGHLWKKLNTGWVELSPSGGVHWLYHLTDPVPGNTKIARQGNTIIAETRGEGGYVIVAPSHGPVHTTGKPWIRIAGGPNTAPTLTTTERAAFHTLLATLGDQPEPVHQDPLPAPTPPDPDAGITPGDDYEAKTPWADILEPHGWTAVTRRGDTTYWRRPGKTTPGFSATTGHAPDRDRLYVFSTNTIFEPETPYTKFGAYALLKHGGNHRAAARALKAKGHGQEPHITIPTIRTLPTNAKHTYIQGSSAEVIDLAQRREAAATRTLDRSDDGNAVKLITTYGDRIRYCPDRGRWLTWDATRWVWQPKGGGYIRELAKRIGRQLPETDATDARHKKASLSALGISNMLTQAQTDPTITVSLDQLDAHPWELNTPSGIVNLRTGHLTPPDPTKLHTKTTSCGPNPDADLTLWEQFLHTTFPDDQDLIDYMQRLVGYSAVGKVEAHILPFAYGSGGNGKGVFLESVSAILGDYATTAPAGFLMASPYQQHSTELAALAGARMVLCSEVDEHDRFDEAKMKRLTGGDTIKARFMRQDEFTFTPTHTLWVAGNFQPQVHSGGDGFWRRLRLIPFTHTVPPEKRIDDLQGILAREHGPAILHWIIQGAAAYARHGLQDPPGVTDATKAYAEAVDTVGRFLEEECITGAAATGMTVPASRLRHLYDRWCIDNGETPVKGKAFPLHLSRHGVLTGRSAPRSNRIRLYGNIGLPTETGHKDAYDGDRGGY